MSELVTCRVNRRALRRFLRRGVLTLGERAELLKAIGLPDDAGARPVLKNDPLSAVIHRVIANVRRAP